MTGSIVKWGLTPYSFSSLSIGRVSAHINMNPLNVGALTADEVRLHVHRLQKSLLRQ
jgi:hypothetical protein